MKKIIFRVDSSYSIGSGHIIRCLNLVKKLNGNIIFISRKFDGNINEKIKENQFKLIAQ